MLKFYVLVALGGALGSVARAACTAGALRLTGPNFPWGTVGINVGGSFLIGALAVLLRSGDARAFLMVGLCGGFTTFSSFSLQTVELARQGRGVAAFANVAVSVGACLGATVLGMVAFRR